jgi:hypothetical protein
MFTILSPPQDCEADARERLNPRLNGIEGSLPNLAPDFFQLPLARAREVFEQTFPHSNAARTVQADRRNSALTRRRGRSSALSSGVGVTSSLLLRDSLAAGVQPVNHLHPSGIDRELRAGCFFLANQG